MKTKNIRKVKNKTKKNFKIKPILKVLNKGYPLYASKKYEGSSILAYNKSEELKYNDKCLKQNSSWFGDLDVAKIYKTKDTNIYKWNVNKLTKLLKITQLNENFINKIFRMTKLELVPSINLTNQQLKKIDYKHDYLTMSKNERALFEFKFCFGYISIEEQYEFMKFIEYLIEKKIIDIKRREGDSIIKKIKLKINYYRVGSLFNKKKKMNRLSFYDIDKHAIMNLCKITHELNINISGVYQKNDTSFWFPDLIVYKMNIQEYILFNPQDNLVFDKLIE